MHDQDVIPEAPQGVDWEGTAKRWSTPSERYGVIDRKQDDPDLIRLEQIRQPPAGPGPGDPGAGLRQVRLEERLDFLRFRVGRRVLARGADHEMALAIDLPLSVGGVGEKRTTRKKQRCPREGPCEKGAPAGAPLRDDGSLSGDTC